MIVAQTSGRLIKVSLESQEKTFLSEGEFQDYSLAYWAKSDSYIAIRISNNRIRLINSKNQEIEIIKFDNAIIGDVLWLSKDIFLVFLAQNVILIDRNNRIKPINRELLKDTEKLLIFSGAVLDENHLFIHLKQKIDQGRTNIFKGRIYNLSGDIKVNIDLNSSLK